MSRRPPLPREHGAWAMFLVSLGVGWIVAGRWNVPGVVFALTAMALFLARQPLALALKARRRRKPFERSLLIWAGIYLAISGLGGIWLVTLGGRAGLLALAPLAGLLAIAYMGHVARRTESSVLGELVGIAGLVLSAPAVYYASTGRYDATAVGLWAVHMLYFSGTVFYIRLKVREQTRQEAPTQLSQRLIAGRACLAYQTTALTLVGLLALLRWVPVLTPLALVPVTVKTIAGAVRWQDRRSLSLMRLGLAEVAHSLVFALLTVFIFGSW
jgi:hypothetical protein